MSFGGFFRYDKPQSMSRLCAFILTLSVVLAVALKLPWQVDAAITTNGIAALLLRSKQKTDGTTVSLPDSSGAPSAE